MQIEQDGASSQKRRVKLKATRHNKGEQESLSSSPVDVDDNDNQSLENSEKQMLVYNACTSNAEQEVSPQPGSTHCRSSSVGHSSRAIPLSSSSRIMPSVGAFAVQCASCFKWRLIPTKEKYEKIRENVLQDPFVCEKAQEWRSKISCDDPADISQDGSRLWAIDKPNIAQPPPGWERILRIRGEGSTKFADVYYAAPSGKRLRSMVEVQKYLLEHPEYANGAKLSQFSFQSPRPLQENYVKKRNIRTANQDEIVGTGAQKLLESPLAKPLETNIKLPIDRPNTPIPLGEPLVSHPTWMQSPPKKRKESPSKSMFNGSMCNTNAV